LRVVIWCCFFESANINLFSIFASKKRDND
jgi:hypothetical protein